MATRRQAYYSKRGPLPDNSDPDVVHRPPRRRDHGANVWLNPKCEHVSTAGVFPQGSYEMERDTGRVQIRSRSVVAPADRQDPLWEHLCSSGLGGLSKFPELRGLVRDSSQHGDLRNSSFEQVCSTCSCLASCLPLELHVEN